MVLRVEGVGVVREVGDARQRLVHGPLRLDRVEEVDGFGGDDPDAADGVDVVLVVLPFPAEDEVLLEAARCVAVTSARLVIGRRWCLNCRYSR